MAAIGGGAELKAPQAGLQLPGSASPGPLLISQVPDGEMRT